MSTLSFSNWAAANAVSLDVSDPATLRGIEAQYIAYVRVENGKTDIWQSIQNEYDSLTVQITQLSDLRRAALLALAPFGGAASTAVQADVVRVRQLGNKIAAAITAYAP